MSQSPQEFDELLRLLARKRHEAPPPGYFDRFAGQVITRIQREEATSPRAGWSTLFAALGWQRLLAAANLAALAGVGIIGVTLVNLRDEEVPDADHFAALQVEEAAAWAASPAAGEPPASPALFGSLPGRVGAIPVGFSMPAENPSATVGADAPSEAFATPSRSSRQMRFYLRE